MGRDDLWCELRRNLAGKAFAEDKSSPEKVDHADNNLFKEFFEGRIARYYDQDKWQKSDKKTFWAHPNLT